MLLMPSPKTARHSAGWRPFRRVTDWAFRYTIPGRYNSLDGSLFALMVARDARR